MSDLFDSMVLELLLACDVLNLKTKRALACVCDEFRCVVAVHMCCWKLVLRPVDCTHANARFIVDHLLPKLPSLELYPEGDPLVPVLKLSELRNKPKLKMIGAQGRMSETAAWFLGHALAHTNCIVRLTTGHTKRLEALRERPRIALSDLEKSDAVNWNIMVGALLANAERRIHNYHTACGSLDLSGLCMDTRMAVAIAPKVHALKGLRDLDLAFNDFGGAAVALLLQHNLPSLEELNLGGTEIGTLGAQALTRAIANVKLPKLKALGLAKVYLRTSDMQALAKVLRFVPDLVSLDLSHNAFVGEGLDALLLEARAGALLKLACLNLNHSWRVSPPFWYRLAVDLKNGAFPCMRTVYCDKEGRSQQDVARGLAVHVAKLQWEEHHNPALASTPAEPPPKRGKRGRCFEQFASENY